MWNRIRTDEYEGMLAETVSVRGYNGDPIHAYFSRPLGKGPFPGIILIPHMPGWDEFCRETARRFSQHGYATICPDIYSRFGFGSPEEISLKARNAGGVPDESVMGDCAAAIDFLKALPNGNGKVGVIGMCSGGRHAYLAACQLNGLSAAIDCWGGNVVMDKEKLTSARPVAPIDYTSELSCPFLGLFGNEDSSPTPEEVDLHEEALKKWGKNYQFYRYDGAGHAFWYYHTDMYRPKQAMDAWQKTFEFFEENLWNPLS